jgi:homoserine O-acetyltransferase
VVQGGISANRAAGALSNAPQPTPWWPQIVGDGLAVDTARVRVLSLEWLTPADYTPADTDGAARPPRAVTTDDQADALAALLSELGIERIAAYVGSSYGGMVALAFASRYPSLLGRLVVVSAAHRAHPYSVALRIIQRRIVQLGLDRGVPDQALALSRQLAMTTFRTPEEFVERFGAAELKETGEFTSDVVDYLDAVGEKFAARFDPERFVALSESVDIHAVEPSAIATPCTLVSVTSDRLIYPEQLRELARRLGTTCDLHEIDSPYGHDAFLKETSTISQIVNDALTF